MAQEINLKIKVDGSGNIIIDQTSEKLKKLGQDGQDAGNKINVAFEVMKGIFEARILEEGVGKMIDFLKESVSAFMEADTSAVRLQNTMHAMGNESGLSQLKDDIAEVSKSSTFAESEFTKAAASLVRFTAIPADQYLRALKLAADMAATSGGTLSGEIEKIGKSTLGMGRGLLEYGVKIKDLQSQGTDIVENMTALEGRVKGADKAMADSAEGGVLMEKKALQELHEDLGQKMMPILNLIIPEFTNFMKGVLEDEDALKAFAKMTLYSATAADALAYGLAEVVVHTANLAGLTAMAAGQFDWADKFFAMSDSASKFQETLGGLGGTLLNAIDDLDNYSGKHDKAKQSVQGHAAAVKELNMDIGDSAAWQKGINEFDHIIEERVKKALEAGIKIKDALAGLGYEALVLPMDNYFKDLDIARQNDLKKAEDSIVKEEQHEQNKYDRLIEMIQKDVRNRVITKSTGDSLILEAEKKFIDAISTMEQAGADERVRININADRDILADIFKMTGIMTEEYSKQEEAAIRAKYEPEEHYLELQLQRSDISRQDYEKTKDQLEILTKEETRLLQEIADKADMTADAYRRKGEAATASGNAGAAAAGHENQHIIGYDGDNPIYADNPSTGSNNSKSSGSKSSRQDPNAPFGSFGGGGFGGLDGSFATGLDYVGSDMVVKVHHKEAILNPENAEAWRQGKGGGLTVGEMHFHAAAGELATQTDQVRFVREVVIPELARAAR